MRTRIVIKRLLVLLLALLLVSSASAQDAPIPPVDALALAADYRGYDGAPVVPGLPDTLAVGDVTSFWVAVSGSDAPVLISATLAAVTPRSYVWLADGVERGQANFSQVGEQIASLWETLRLRANYIERAPLPVEGDVSAFVDRTDLLPAPDADGDPRLHILYGRDLREDFYFNLSDSLPAAVAPSDQTNARELLYVNTTTFAGVPLDDGIYVIGMLRALYNFVMHYNVPNQAPWLTETMGNSVLQQLQNTTVATGEIDGYFSNVETTSPIRASTFANRAATNGAQGLFLSYLTQRYGGDVYRDLFLAEGQGWTPVDTVLARRGIIDPVTALPVTALDVFADFTVANLVNAGFGDGRYQHTAVVIGQNQFPRFRQVTALPDAVDNAQVAQFGAAYTLFGTREATSVRVTFDGGSAARRLPMEREGAEPFWWSGRGAGRRTLTTALDLLGVNPPSLTFDAWYSLADGWNYTYVSVSTDNGATWTIVTPEYAGEIAGDGVRMRNPFGAAYGDGLTGISNPAGAQPFPIVGVVIQGDGVTLGEVSPGGPADLAGIEPGDVVLGYEGQRWQSAPDIIGMLTQYAPGDTLTLLIQRGERELEIPIILGAHPTRIRQPEPRWLPFRVDLSAFRNQPVLVRLDTVMLPGRDDHGIAIANLAIGDRALEWAADGFQEVTNAIEQRWLVQAVTTGTRTTPARVRPLIRADGFAGEWTIDLRAGEALIMIVSAVSADAADVGTYSLSLAQN
jgi:hypothetical protein